jgi:ATP-dependent DNA ligase
LLQRGRVRKKIRRRGEAALYAAVCAHGLEGVVAKKLSSRYAFGERGWVKTKDPEYWRRDAEIEAMQRSRERRTRVLG